MGIIVSKFGGSSMADADCFRRVKKIIQSQNRRQYIVVSAPGKRNKTDDKITDLLMHSHMLYASGQDGSTPLNIVRQRFAGIIHELNLHIDPADFMKTLENDVRHSADLAASRGEYFCAKLFAAYVKLPFVDAGRLIHFDKNGHIQRDEITRAVCAMADRFPSAVIPGFYGSLPDGNIKTFTRGGSDITGALIAAAMNADIYENWTDVDGLMSADPSVCPGAACHYAVSYRQMRMLAAAGAQILHPYCVEPVCEAGIPTVLKNTFVPENPGTYISDNFRRNVCCVCAQKGYAVALDELSLETQQIAKGIVDEEYSNGMILLKQNSGAQLGRAVAVISAFGLSVQQQSEAAMQIPCLGELHYPHCSRYIVLPKDCENAQRILHSLITERVTESRIPSDFCERCHSTR